jgi:hypothetical protein
VEKFNELKNAILVAEKDATRFYEKGNKSAGTRLRAHMQDVKRLANEVRQQVSAMKNSMVETKEDAPAA